MQTDIEQHSLSRSIALHLLPGALILGFYLAVGVPVATRLGYPSLFGLLLAVAFVLVPFELGWLLYLGTKRNGRLSLQGIVLYRDRMPVRRLATLVSLLFGWAVLVGATLSWIDAMLLEGLFSWVPHRYLIEQGLGSYLTRYPQIRPDRHAARRSGTERRRRPRGRRALLSRVPVTQGVASGALGAGLQRGAVRALPSLDALAGGDEDRLHPARGVRRVAGKEHLRGHLGALHRQHCGAGAGGGPRRGSTLTGQRRERRAHQGFGNRRGIRAGSPRVIPVDNPGAI
jgi:hypothetical protein